MSNVLINKAEAARRLTEAAIRLHFQEEDSLAIHTIIAAGGSILTDLAENRASNPENDFWKTTIKDMMARFVVADSIISKRMEQGASEQEAGLSSEEFQVLDVSSVEIPEAAVEQRFTSWRKGLLGLSRTPANFLKHAKKDPGALLGETWFDDRFHILRACVLFGQLSFTATGPMLAYIRWVYAVQPINEHDHFTVSPGISDESKFAHAATREEQLEFGRFLLSSYNPDEDKWWDKT